METTVAMAEITGGREAGRRQKVESSYQRRAGARRPVYVMPSVGPSLFWNGAVCVKANYVCVREMA